MLFDSFTMIDAVAKILNTTIFATNRSHTKSLTKQYGRTLISVGNYCVTQGRNKALPQTVAKLLNTPNVNNERVISTTNKIRKVEQTFIIYLYFNSFCVLFGGNRMVICVLFVFA